MKDPSKKSGGGVKSGALFLLFFWTGFIWFAGEAGFDICVVVCLDIYLSAFFFGVVVSPRNGMEWMGMGMRERDSLGAIYIISEVDRRNLILHHSHAH